MASSKFLFDTSCVLGKLHPSFRDLRRQTEEIVGDGELWTTWYLRMEFYRRWILTWIRLYFAAKRHGNLDEAIVWAVDKYGDREAKAVGHLLAAYHNAVVERGSDEREAIERVGELIYRIAYEYEQTFSKRWENNCGCQRRQTIDRSGKTLDIALQIFYKEFSPDVQDCPINSFLNFKSDSPKYRPIRGRRLKLKVVGSRKDGFKKLTERFESYVKKNEHICCTQCERIGDVVIVLDMPKRALTLLHTDYAFDYLCESLGIPHRRLNATRAVSPEKDVLADLMDS
jgi:hypothetical protein